MPTRLSRSRNDRTLRRALCLAALLSTTVGCGAQPEELAVPTEPAGGAITMWTDSTELFMEHPALIVGQPEKFAVHLTDLTDFAPLRTGRITMRFVPRGGGAPLVVVQDEPRAPGIYGPAPAFTDPGEYDLTILVDSPQARDSISVPGLRVYARAEDAPLEDAGGDEGIVLLKEQQWKAPGFATAFATTGEAAQSFTATGEIRAADGRWAEVSAPISALVGAGGVAPSPTTGTRVARGDILALLTPSVGDGGSSFTEARAALREAEDEFARATRLFASEAVPQRRVHEAENRLRAAREALAGLGGGELSENGLLAVRSPIDGIVAARHLTPGSRVEAGAPLFSLVDSRVVWLLVHVPATEAARIDGRAGAEFTLEGGAERYRAGRTISIGSVIDVQSRTIPVLYEVANASGAIRIGAFARVAVRTGRQAQGVLIPTSALLDEDGRAVVYVQLSGERFEKREVTVQAVDGTRAIVSGQIAVGERIVTGAAYQVRLASLSTSVPAEGHEH